MLKTEKNTLSYCELCQRDVILCGMCGNNTCNGGYGEINGHVCEYCPSAYDDDRDLYQGYSYLLILDKRLLTHQKERLERKIDLQAEQITRLETSRRELRRQLKELLSSSNIAYGDR